MNHNFTIFAPAPCGLDKLRYNIPVLRIALIGLTLFLLACGGGGSGPANNHAPKPRPTGETVRQPGLASISVSIEPYWDYSSGRGGKPTTDMFLKCTVDRVSSADAVNFRFTAQAFDAAGNLLFTTPEQHGQVTSPIISRPFAFDVPDNAAYATIEPGWSLEGS